MKNLEQDIQLKDDYIRIINGKSFTSKHLTVCNIKEWFNVDYYTIKEIDNQFFIKKCYFDIPKNAIKLNRLNNILSIVTYLEAGKYYVDLEKTEDKLIITLK